MADQQHNPVKDSSYNLITVVQESLKNVWMLENYIHDAEQHGDEELARWFRKIQENNTKAGQQGKELLQQRLNNE